MINRDEIKKLVKGKGITDHEGLQALMREISREVIEILLDEEMNDHLGYSKHSPTGNNSGNSRNGKSRKNVKSNFGELDLSTPRDREGTFSPQLVKKRQRDISGIESKVVSMYAKGMSTRDISDHIDEIYGFQLSAESISAMTDKVSEKATEWQNRPLESVYPIVFMDGIRVKVRVDGAVKIATVYVIIGIGIDGRKSCLGLYIAESESAKYWLSVMNELKNRGIEDIFIIAVDNLSGISDAIMTAFPKTEIQKCVVHQIRNSLKFVSWKDRKKVASDLKTIYSAATEEDALRNLDIFTEKYNKQYPHIIKSWKTNWDELATFFKYSKAIRTLIYTTNPIESFNRGIRKVTKNRAIFPTEKSLIKLFYLATMDIEKKWTMSIRNWSNIIAELSIFFEERLEKFIG